MITNKTARGPGGFDLGVSRAPREEMRNAKNNCQHQSDVDKAAEQVRD